MMLVLEASAVVAMLGISSALLSSSMGIPLALLKTRTRVDRALSLPLPLTSPPSSSGPRLGVTRPVLRFAVVFVVLLAATLLLALPNWRDIPALVTTFPHRLPPLYSDFRAREQRLAHYDAYETNRSIKYFWAAQHAHSGSLSRLACVRR